MYVPLKLVSYHGVLPEVTPMMRSDWAFTAALFDVIVTVASNHSEPFHSCHAPDRFKTFFSKIFKLKKQGLILGRSYQMNSDTSILRCFWLENLHPS